MNNRKQKDIYIVIPSLEPDEKLIHLIRDLRNADFQHILVIDDGSPESYNAYFSKAKEAYHCTVLRHAINLGKGRALKTAFNYLLTAEPECAGMISVDSDGQHQITDIIKCAEELSLHPNALILGCRDFTSENNIPARSKFGNIMTKHVLHFLCGINVSDTQTGLRGLSRELMALYLDTNGERFEFEMNMIIETKEKEIQIVQVPIQTIYLNENSSSHFNPLLDSFKIYAVFLKFILSSLSSFVVDIVLFTIFVYFLKPTFPFYYIALATLFARVFSSIFNFHINKNRVFHKTKFSVSMIVKYGALCLLQLLLSAFLVSALFGWLHMASGESFLKIIVDCTLFLCSYKIQQEWVFRH